MDVLWSVKAVCLFDVTAQVCRRLYDHGSHLQRPCCGKWRQR